ncbi:hypothetical protein [Luteococcus sp. OSA5]|uniref:hypothetical protein n=1 Tax=Luteococcus sp. OSA5 TaxID=3401630 RepID=UPI003B43AD4F
MFGPYAPRGRLSDYLDGCLRQARSGVSGFDADYVIQEDPRVAVAVLMDQHFPKPVVFRWELVTRSDIRESTGWTNVYRQYGITQSSGQTFQTSELDLRIPVEGSGFLLDYQASTFRLSGGMPNCRLSGDTLTLTINERELTAEVIESEFENLKSDATAQASYTNDDLAKYTPHAEQVLLGDLQRRRERLLKDRALDAALQIPVHSTGTPAPPVPAQRKFVSLPDRRAQAGSVPEPVLADAIYNDILQAVRAWANGLERVPTTTSQLGEEGLRDLLLAHLNGYWQGQAGGELFNGAGKTDILIREGDRNAFIAECKIWHGPKAAQEAIDQLLSYLVWRDSKAALIMFVKTSNPGATVDKLHEAVSSHPSHLLTVEDAQRASRSVHVFAADKEGRRVSLAVIPVVIAAGGA